jgi:hypothetical protein
LFPAISSYPKPRPQRDLPSWRFPLSSLGRTDTKNQRGGIRQPVGGRVSRPTDSSADFPQFEQDVSRRELEVKSRTGTQNTRTCALPFGVAQTSPFMSASQQSRMATAPFAYIYGNVCRHPRSHPRSSCMTQPFVVPCASSTDLKHVIANVADRVAADRLSAVIVRNPSHQQLQDATPSRWVTK